MSERLKEGQLMRRDRHTLRRGKLHPDAAMRSAQIRSDREARHARLDSNLAANLPIAACAEEILRAIHAHPVVIVAGDTGSGKTTQLPKLCLQLGFGVDAMVGHTQPRRLAARSVANRLADELNCEPGQEVAHAVRFDDRTGDSTIVKLMTDGLLLTEIRTDRFLDAYDVIIVDEAHERSLNIDFLLGYLRRLSVRRPDLKLIITSATIDVERFSSFFNDAPVVRVAGRSYPVEVCYREPAEDTLAQIVDVLEEISVDRSPGRARDVLVFFPGERDIFDAARAIRRAFDTRLAILPLYARLSASEQRRIFSATGGQRRVILATNVAETALTVPNIGFVIDTGLARVNRYSYRSKLQRLPIEPISQASADQRKGRCGRIAPGTCYRLYEESDFLTRPAYTDPEIRRVNLASVVLQMQAFKLGDIRKFPFLDPPEPRAVSDAMRLLTELQALEAGRLTKVGREMARMPLDPRLARMLVEAGRQGAIAEMSIIAAGLAVQDPRQRPLQQAQAADQAHERFADERSDFVGWLNLWRWVETQRQELTANRWAKALARAFIKPQGVREWRAVHRQLRIVCQQLGYRENAKAPSYRALHECILAGSLSLIAQHEEQGQYLGPRGLKLRVFPGSALAGRTPRWVVAGEIAETRRVYARNVASVDAAWIERQARHLLKYNYSAPYWSANRGEVLARQSASLYGLRLIDGRPVSYAKHDPVVCRDLFIRDGLVAGAVKQPPDFLRHNLMQVAHVRDLESKGRRRDLLASDDDLYAFYDKRIPRDVSRTADLKRWLGSAAHAEQSALFMTEDDVKRGPIAGLAEDDFPSVLELDGLAFDLKYRFAPGEPDDGVTLRVPVGLLPVIQPEALEWIVPGLFEPMVEQWLRSLPKQKRRRLAPLPDKLSEFTTALLQPGRYRKGRLLTALGDLLRDRFDLHTGEEDWDRSRIPEHLLLYIQIVDESGEVCAAGRDLRRLRSELRGGLEGAIEPGGAAHEVTGLTAFPEDGIADQLLLGSEAAPFIKFPGLVDSDNGVDLRLFDDAGERDRAHRDGLCRLALQHLGQIGRYFRRELDKHPALELHFASLGGARRLQDEVLRAVVWYCFFEGRDTVSDRAQFDERIASRKGDLGNVFNVTVSLFALILAGRFECVRRLDDLKSEAYAPSKRDIRAHLNSLAPPTVLSDTPERFLALVPGYLRGIRHRIEHLEGHVPRDQRVAAELDPLIARLHTLSEAEIIDGERWIALRFLLEELRFKLHAQPLYRRSTPHPIDGSHIGPGWKASIKRLDVALLNEEQRVGLA